MFDMRKPYMTLDGIEKNFIALYGENTHSQKMRYEQAFKSFKKEFNVDCAYVASSSGRVEVCGNHTDHNGGKVLSCAISLDTIAMFLPTNDDIVTINSQGYPKIEVDLNNDCSVIKGTSSALVSGVAKGIRDRGYKIGGFKALFVSNVPNGAGVSSSASFELLVCEIFNFLYNDGKISKEERAIISQFAENVYFGKPCGLLDQTAISFGGLKKLDFKDKNKIEVTSINNSLADYTLVLIDTGGSHENLTDEYASIPKEMFSVANALGKDRLIEIDKQEFLDNLPLITSTVSDRAILRSFHFFEENERVENACVALNKNDFAGFLDSVKQSGISSLCKLQNCFVSGSDCQTIPKALAICSVYLNGGANRIHGGGFAGSILNIVKNEHLEQFINSVSKYFGKDKVIPLRVRSVGTIVL